MESRGSTRGGGEVERVAWGAQVERVRRFRTLLVIGPKVAGCSGHTGKHGENRSGVVRERCGRSEDRRFVLFTFSLTEIPAISYCMPLAVLIDLDLTTAADFLSYRQVYRTMVEPTAIWTPQLQPMSSAPLVPSAAPFSYWLPTIPAYRSKTAPFD